MYFFSSFIFLYKYQSLHTQNCCTNVVINMASLSPSCSDVWLKCYLKFCRKLYFSVLFISHKIIFRLICFSTENCRPVFYISFSVVYDKSTDFISDSPTVSKMSTKKGGPGSTDNPLFKKGVPGYTEHPGFTPRAWYSNRGGSHPQVPSRWFTGVAGFVGEVRSTKVFGRVSSCKIMATSGRERCCREN